MTVLIVLEDGTIGTQDSSPPVITLGVGAFEGYVHFHHDCINGYGDAFRSRGSIPLLPHARGWTLVSADPLTVTPSVLCIACQTHGFITDGKWISA